LNKNIIYFDNAATSWPKPKKVIEQMEYYLNEIGGNPGRSGHRMSILASRLVEDAREAVAKILNFNDTSRIIFTKNATEAINICIFGILQPGDHAITSSVEHNSVMRPLRYLESKGLKLSIVKCDSDGSLDPEDILKEIRPDTKLVVLTHASNITGTILPIKEVASFTAERGIPFLIDCAQTAGAIPTDIDIKECENCILAFTGHKSLFGPTGTGGMCFGEKVKMRPLIFGGTGSSSDYDTQPNILPDKFESGTINIMGLAGLKAGIDFLIKEDIKKVREHEKRLVHQFILGAAKIKGLKIYGPRDPEKQVGIISFNLSNLDPSKVGLILDKKYSIMSRIGLHCNPNAHKTIGTFPEGTVRFGFSYFNTLEQICAAMRALQELADINNDFN